MNYINKNLTKFVKNSGWAAKLDPCDLKTTLSFLESSKELLSNLNTNEDASVFKISEDLALVQTLDFITPIVDSPYHFGSISAANSLSDVFAMGADVINALNIVGFDNKNLDIQILKEILSGANDKVKESGGIIAFILEPSLSLESTIG